MTVCVSQQMVDGTGSHSTKGGGDAIGFFKPFMGMSFQDAVRTLAGEDFKTIPATQAEHRAKPPERAAFALPPKNNGNRRVFAYLHRSRGIAAEIINPLYQE